jgi:hypothetical protein
MQHSLSEANGSSTGQEIPLHFMQPGGFNTVFSITRLLSLSWARLIQSTPYQPISLR